MTALAVRPESAPASAAVIESEDFADLACIYRPEVNLCLIRRRPEAALRRFVSEFLRSPHKVELAEEIRFEHFDFASLLADHRAIPGHGAWWRDVARLVGAYCELLEVERVGLRLRTLDRPMCPRFHVDHVLCRLVCTYGGLGTQWLPDDCVERSKLGPGAKGLADEDSGLILDEQAIRTLPAYGVGLMKGELWPGSEGQGAVHRSPRPTPQEPRRLLLTVDAL